MVSRPVSLVSARSGGRKPSGDAPARSDSRLVEALRAGNPEARAWLVQRHYQRVTAVLHRVLGRDPEIADLAQEVFMQAFLSISRFRGTAESLEFWLVRIAVFTARAALRKRTSWRRHFSPMEDADDNTSTDAGSPEQREELRCVYRVLDEMPANERIILALYMMDQMSLNEIADTCKLSKSTTIRRLKRARRRFQVLARRYPALEGRLKGDDK